MAGGSELGSAHVSIFPQMKGFRQNVAKETGKAVSDMKNSFTKGFNGAQQGKQNRQRLQKRFQQWCGRADSETLKSFKKDVAQASQKNTDALLNSRRLACRCRPLRKSSARPHRNMARTARR